MSARALALALLLPAAALAQGYAGLGTEAEGYAQVTAPASLSFPRDHGAHPAFRIEWWYLTANLTGADGREYGAQWTLFRQSVTPEPPGAGWASNQLWMAHAALTSAGEHRVAEKFARGGIGQAGVALGPFRAWIDDWEVTAAGDALSELRVRAGGEGFHYELGARADRAPVLQGEEGYSLKSEAGQASYYYSHPFYEVAGRIAFDGREMAVTGVAWLDREWSSQPLSPGQEGWDWFALHLGSGAKVMVYRFREGGGRSRAAGTWISAGGRPEALGEGEVAAEPVEWAEVAGREVPVEWRIAIPGRGFEVDTVALNAQSWMATSFPYWEGPIRFEGSHDGRGYLEMTGYD